MDRFELCVIGSGPGGQKAAIQAAKLGRRVCIVEKMEQVGGVAIHTGTIPSKALREAIIQVTQGRDHLTVRGEVKSGRIGIGHLLRSCQRIIATEMEIVQGQLRRNGVEILTGEASFTGEHTLSIKGTQQELMIEADKFVIAVGTEPACPRDIPFDQDAVLTSDDLLHMQSLPEILIVVGAGVIGTEFASMFSRLGIRVTLVDKAPRVLGFLDQQIGEALQFHLRNRGMVLRLCEEVATIAIGEGQGRRQVTVDLKSGKKLVADTLLYCRGRQGATEALNLSAVGLAADRRGLLEVDESFRTRNPDIFAVGDVIGFPALASTSMNQGRRAACHIFGCRYTGTGSLFPFGIYSIPEISMVGDNEEQLTEKGIPYETGTASYREIARGQIVGDGVGMLKILFSPEDRKVLGVHILGTGATELVHIGQAVMTLGGTVDYFVENAFNYPTLAECYRVAALNGINKLQN